MKLTIEQLSKELQDATVQNRSFECSNKECGWKGNEPLLVDYDDRGPHFECPVCRSEIQVGQPS